MRRPWIDEELHDGQILYQPTPDIDGKNSWAQIRGWHWRVEGADRYREYKVKLLTHNQSNQTATLEKIISKGLLLWEPPPADSTDVAALERWLALDQPTPPTFAPGTP